MSNYVRILSSNESSQAHIVDIEVSPGRFQKSSGLCRAFGNDLHNDYVCFLSGGSIE